MKYLLLVYFDEQDLSETEWTEFMSECRSLIKDLKSRKNYLGANPLHPTSTATSVRMRNKERLVTDGPFAETREQLGGYFLIDARDLDEAISIAALVPMARKGMVEIRPVFDIPGRPED